MGLGGINIWSLLVILVIVLAVFGTKKLRNMGGDLGGAVKGFKNAVKDGTDEVKETAENLENKAGDAIDSATAKSNSDKV